jgi:hypothetical protein
MVAEGLLSAVVENGGGEVAAKAAKASVMQGCPETSLRRQKAPPQVHGR